MSIDQVQFTAERWRQFWANFRGEPQQLEGIERLRQHILQADPGLLSEGADWVAAFHQAPGRRRCRISKVGLATVMDCSVTNLPDWLMEELASCCDTFEINTPLRLAYFLGQVGEESGGLRYPIEITSGEDYEGRRDLGNLEVGDGRKYKGAGYIQVTGRFNHQSFSDYLAAIGTPDPNVMELGSSYTCNKYPWSISGFWWHNNQMNQFCDAWPSIDAVGAKVNGVFPPRGAAERRAYTERAMKVLGVRP